MTRHGDGDGRIAVCRADDIDHGERTIVEVGGVEVGVFNLGGEFYALLNSCRHQHGPVCEGDLKREVTADPLEVGRGFEERYTDSFTVICPWHQWSYDVRTGEHSGDRDISLPTFDVDVEDGTVYLVL